MDPFKARWQRDGVEGWAVGPRGIALTNIAYDVEEMFGILFKIQELVAESMEDSGRHSTILLELCARMMKTYASPFIKCARELELMRRNGYSEEDHFKDEP